MDGEGGRAEQVDLRKLRIFAAVAAVEHYSRAAAALGISQPALSVHVRDLERHFGVPLFARAGRNVRLTEAGRVVHGYARRILALASELDGAVGDLRGLRVGLLRLGASTTIGEYLLPALLGTFRGRYPGIGVAVEIANTRRIADRLRHGELHLALIGEPLDDPELRLEPYRDDLLRLIVPPAHPWAGRVIAPAELAAAPLIAREVGSATRQVTEDALQTAGLTATTALELGGTEAVKGAVAAGLGVAFVSSCAVHHELASGRLATATVAGLVIRRQFQIAQHRARRLSAVEVAFLSFLHDEQSPAMGAPSDAVGTAVRAGTRA